jgi:hypothetical protein
MAQGAVDSSSGCASAGVRGRHAVNPHGFGAGDEDRHADASGVRDRSSIVSGAGPARRGPLRRSGFHALDGAWRLQELHWHEPVAGLVGHHSAAGLVAAVRGLVDPVRLPGPSPRLRSGSRCADLRRSDHRPRWASDGRRGPARRDAAPARPGQPERLSARTAGASHPRGGRPHRTAPARRPLTERQVRRSAVLTSASPARRRQSQAAGRVTSRTAEECAPSRKESFTRRPSLSPALVSISTCLSSAASRSGITNSVDSAAALTTSR